MPDFKEINSSWAKAVAHDASTDTLYVQFKGGRQYAYEGVPPDLYEKLISADSHGKFFHAAIAKYFSGQEITGED